MNVRAKALPYRDLALPLANLALRLGSLVGKFGLSLFIARFLDLAELGVYGIIFAVSMFMVVFLGGRIDHELCRQIVLERGQKGARLLRDQSVFFLLNFVAAFPLFVLAGSFGMTGFGPRIAICTWAICCLEAYANLLFVNTNALGKSLHANIVFFIRSGFWAFAAMAALLLFPELRTLWTVLLLWIAGSAAAIWINLDILMVRRWPSLGAVTVDWGRLRAGLRISSLIWISSIGLAGGTYLDRVVLSGYHDLKAVGVATFYSSFSNAVVTLVASSCLAVVLPKLVRLADAKDWRAFWRELGRAGYSILFLGASLCLGVAIAVPYSAFILKKPEIFLNREMLWLLMAAAMVRIVAEGVFIALYALRLDRPIWLGNIAFLLLSLITNIAFIARFGLIGLGYASLLATLLLLLFRSWGLMTFGRSVRLAHAA